MKKNEKIMIGILVLILLVMIGILILNKVKINKQDIWIYKDNPVSGKANNLDSTEKEIGRIIKVNGTLYYDTGEKSTELRCGMMDGNITKVIKETEIPENNGEANFVGAEGYQYGRENTIEVPLDGEWVIFAPKEYSFCGVIKQVEQNLFFVEPDEGEEIRKSADKIMVGKLKLDTNVKFEVGERVKITYDGDVMETYPAQIKAIRYENIENKEFTIKVYDKSPEEYNVVHKILDKDETVKYDYDIYAYKVSVNIVINGEEMSLRNALLENKITMEEIIEKSEDYIPKPVVYEDGGSVAYPYETYTIIKVHNLEGNRDVYIGMPGLDINDLEL